MGSTEDSSVRVASVESEAPSAPDGPSESGPVRLSVVIPVYNSAEILSRTVEATVEFLESLHQPYEVILVNDGSRDGSWDVLRDEFQQHRHVIAINMLKNYGQHTATLCGLRHSRGEYAVTLDDDMQNPPGEIAHLLDKVDAGHDLVFGRYVQKMHSPVRRLGSRLVNQLNARIFGKPKDIKLTNFRIMDRRLVDRILSHKTNYPYINGLAIMYAHRPANKSDRRRSWNF